MDGAPFMASQPPAPRTRWVTSIRTKLGLTIIVAAVVPLLLVGYTSYTTQRSLELEDAFARLEGLAAAQVGQLEQMVEADRDAASIIANHPDVRQALTATIPPERTAAALASFIEVVPRLEGVAIYDADGEPVSATEHAASSQLTAAMVGSGNNIGTVLAREDGTLVMVSCTELQIDGRMVGTVIVETGIQPITDLATNYEGLSTTGETSVAQLDANGDAQFIAPLRFRDDAVMSLTVPASAQAAPVTRALAGEEGRFSDTVDYRAEPVLAVTRTVPGTGWGVVVKLDRAEALAQTGEFQSALLAAIVAAVGLGLLASVALARRISDPLHRLTRTATSITAGDVGARTSVSRPDEIGTLAHAMNSMADSLVDAATVEANRTAELEELNDQLTMKEAGVRSILETAAEGIISVASDGTILQFNRAAETIFDTSAEQVVGTAVTGLLSIRGDARKHQGVVALTIALRHGPDGIEMEARRPTGASVPVHVAVSAVDTDRGTTTYTAILRDISERIAFERQLSHLATHDSLTGLPNRDLFGSRLERALSDPDHRAATIAVLFVDLDRFKVVNDSWGHKSGDKLLRQVATRLSGAVREADVIARFGGDEFVLLLTELSDTAEARVVGHRILAALKQPFVVGSNATYVTASVGIAMMGDREATAENLVSDADVAMYRAKQRGRNRVEVFDGNMRSWVESRHELDTELRKAIDGGELDVAYQPIVDVKTGEYVAVEALSRWTHPELGVVAPTDFISVAEETGLIVDLGRYVFETVCRQLAGWQTEHLQPIPASVNLSARELVQPDCVDAMRSAIRASGVDPTMLTVEVTESMFLSDPERAIHNLNLIRALGIKIALDDFGTGYSSLTYLRQLPIDIVKIDRAFMREVVEETHDRSIVAMVLALGESMGIRVIAEGVENEEQRQALLELGVEWAQGYLFAQAQTAERAEAMLWPVTEPIDVPVGS